MRLVAARPRTRLTAALVGGRRLWLDRSPSLVLACCSCQWRRPAATDRAGWRAAADHLRRCHDDTAGAKMCETLAARAC